MRPVLATDPGPPRAGLFWAAGCGLRAAGCGLRAAGCGPGRPGGPDQCGAGQAAGQDMAKMRGATGCGPNYIVTGRVRAQLSSPRRSKCSHCLYLLVGGLPDSSLCA